MMDYRKLRGRIREKYGTQQAFADALGISVVTLSLKLNNRLQWKTDEIARACELLEIPLGEAVAYFFTKKV